MQRSRRNVSQTEGSVSAKALRWEYFQNREETSWLEGVGASRRVAGSEVGGVGRRQITQGLVAARESSALLLSVVGGHWGS